MKKHLFLTASALCLMAMPVMADCVCGQTGCKPCEDTEDYLEDVGEHFKKQAKKIKKRVKHSQKEKQNDKSTPCMSDPVFWSETAELLDANGDIVMYYAEIAEDDTFILTPEQKTQAAMNVQNMKKAGEQLKKKVADKRQECLGVIETEEVVVAVPAGEAVNLTKMKANSKKAMKEMQQKGKSNATKQAKWLSQMDQNGDMLIEAAEFIDLNANQ